MGFSSHRDFRVTCVPFHAPTTKETTCHNKFPATFSSYRLGLTLSGRGVGDVHSQVPHGNTHPNKNLCGEYFCVPLFFFIWWSGPNTVSFFFLSQSYNQIQTVDATFSV